MAKRLVLALVVLLAVAATASATSRDRDRDHDGLPDRWERQYRMSTRVASAMRASAARTRSTEAKALRHDPSRTALLEIAEKYDKLEHYVKDRDAKKS